jgi:alpha-L-arabinofuranosidase
MENNIIVNADQGRHVIDKNIYGHFAEHLGRCIYDGVWVGENSPIPNTRGIRNDIVAALKRIKAPVIRWPGGCFADKYHWKDAVGKKAERKKIVNTHWGNVVEDNHFGTHEFFDFCELVGAEPYICGNVGSGTVEEMQEWLEYMNFDGPSTLGEWRRRNGREKPFGLKYFGIGNENWGCGGRMRPEYYADLYRRFQTYANSYSGHAIYKIACGPRNDDYNWTEVLMREAGRLMDGLALHYYSRLFSSGENKSEWRGLALEFPEQEYFAILKKAQFTEELVARHSTIMDRHDPNKKVGLVVDEWGTWYGVEPGTNPDFLYQQNSIRDALVAGVSLNIFNNHADRVRMANIAQTINVLQAVVLTKGEKMLLTPTYHVFDMYKDHQDALMLPLVLAGGAYAFKNESISQLSASASLDKAGAIRLSVCNIDPKRRARVGCHLRGAKAGQASARILCGPVMNAHNSFESPNAVKPEDFTGISLKGTTLKLDLPPLSLAVVTLKP